MGSISSPALFSPTKVGASQLKHRVVFAPCTRFRCDPETHAPIVPLKKTYYEQRASVPGTLIISEGTIVAEKACGMGNVPGIWSTEQMTAWKEVGLLALFKNLVSLTRRYHTRSPMPSTQRAPSFTSNYLEWAVQQGPNSYTAILVSQHLKTVSPLLGPTSLIPDP
jgi:NADH:flavin oxidoreductase / NADH oxidase family